MKSLFLAALLVGTSVPAQAQPNYPKQPPGCAFLDKGQAPANIAGVYCMSRRGCHYYQWRDPKLAREYNCIEFSKKVKK